MVRENTFVFGKCLSEILKSCSKPPANPAWTSCHNVSYDVRVIQVQLLLTETFPSLVPCFNLMHWQYYSWQNWGLAPWCVILVFSVFSPSAFDTLH